MLNHNGLKNRVANTVSLWTWHSPATILTERQVCEVNWN